MSTKPPSVLKGDIKKVLDRMQVQYHETKGGFECIHIPSIDISSVPESQSRHSHGNNLQHRRRGSSGSNETGKTGNISISMSMNMNTPRSLVKKASKLSFGMGKSHDRESVKEKERDAEMGMNVSMSMGMGMMTMTDKELPHRPSVGTALSTTPSSGSSSFFNMSSTATTTATGHTAHTVMVEGSRHGDVNGTMTTMASPADDAYGFPPQTPRSQSPTKGEISYRRYLGIS
jgi:serine/threonine protein kinase KIN1/2